MHPPVTAQGKARQKPGPLHTLMPFGPNQNFWPGDVRDDQPHSSVATFLNRIPDVPNILPHRRRVQWVHGCRTALSSSFQTVAVCQERSVQPVQWDCA